jgi:regulator of cell morphogenesis and NO signaling
MNITTDTPVGEIVKANFKTAKIFENYGIDFCCGGDKSLGSACSEKNVDPLLLLPEIQSTLEISDADAKYFVNLSPEALIDYIVERHHGYVNDHLPFLQQKLQKLCDVHGAYHPELHEIKELFDGAAGNLSMHMKKEELILFPLIKKIFRTKQRVDKSLKEIIEVMNSEHSTEGKRFEDISRLSGNYSVPSDGCSTYEVTFQTLAEFEKDLHRHIHLENNILFPAALKLEKELRSN